jgi:hypothetical protein
MVYRLVLSSLLLLPIVHSAKIVIWEHDNCSGTKKTQSFELGVSKTPKDCYARNWDGGDKGVTIVFDEDDEEQQSQMLVFFASRECDPDFVLNSTEGGVLGCESGKWLAELVGV